MQIILMRHGEAEDLQVVDCKRKLTNFGQIQAQHAAAYILENYSPDLFIVSSFIRAKQTLDYFAHIASDVSIYESEDITPNVDAEVGILALSHIIQNHSTKVDCVLVVCHMPIVANMVSILTGKRADMYNLAEARVLEFNDVHHIAEYLGKQTETFIPIQHS